MPLPDAPAVVSRVSLRDAAYARLRDWIIDGTLAPHEPLRDEALADALGMSRTPVREALQRLEDEGLVTTSASRRSFVSPCTLSQAREVFPIVATLETLAVRLALPRVDTPALDAMRAANVALARALDAGVPAEAVDADFRLHAAFVERSGNSELIATLDGLKSKVRRIERAFWGGADRRASLGDHDALIAAFAARDTEAARQAITRNWERALEWIPADRT